MIKPLVHYGCHLLIPLAIVLLFYRQQWKVAYITMLAAFLIDLDHLLVTPIFDTNRCSIGYHPLHSYFAILFYIFSLIPKTSRLVALGLVIHIVSDYVDCLML